MKTSGSITKMAEKKDDEILEVVTKGGKTLRRTKDGKFLPGNKEAKGLEHTNRMSPGKIAKLFDQANKAYMVKFSRMTVAEIRAIKNNPESTIHEVRNANIWLNSIDEVKGGPWCLLMERILKTPRQLEINPEDLNEQQRETKQYKTVFVIPSNNREGS